METVNVGERVPGRRPRTLPFCRILFFSNASLGLTQKACLSARGRGLMGDAQLFLQAAGMHSSNDILVNIPPSVLSSMCVEHFLSSQICVHVQHFWAANKNSCFGVFPPPFPLAMASCHVESHKWTQTNQSPL